jgi:Ca2+-binding EF-hand superfamily protein
MTLSASKALAKLRRAVFARADAKGSDPSRLVLSILRKYVPDANGDISAEMLRTLLRDYFRINLSLKRAADVRVLLDQTGDGILTRTEAIESIVADATPATEQSKRILREEQEQVEQTAIEGVWVRPIVDGFSDQFHQNDDAKQRRHSGERPQGVEYHGTATAIIKLIRQKILSCARNDKDVVRKTWEKLRKHDGVVGEYQNGDQLKHAFAVMFDVNLAPAKAQQVFNMLDQDGNGVLTREEVVRALAGVDDKRSLEQDDNLRMVSDNLIEQHEERKRSAMLAPTRQKPKYQGSARSFIALLKEKIMAHARTDGDVVRRMTNILRKHDGVRSDTLGVADLHRMVRVVFDIDLPLDKVQEVFTVLDVNRDGVVTREEIVRGLTGLGAYRPVNGTESIRNGRRRPSTADAQKLEQVQVQRQQQQWQHGAPPLSSHRQQQQRPLSALPPRALPRREAAHHPMPVVQREIYAAARARQQQHLYLDWPAELDVPPGCVRVQGPGDELDDHAHDSENNPLVGNSYANSYGNSCCNDGGNGDGYYELEECNERDERGGPVHNQPKPPSRPPLVRKARGARRPPGHRKVVARGQSRAETNFDLDVGLQGQSMRGRVLRRPRSAAAQLARPASACSDPASGPASAGHSGARPAQGMRRPSASSDCPEPAQYRRHSGPPAAFERIVKIVPPRRRVR